MKTLKVLVFLLLNTSFSFSQAPKQYSSSDIYHLLKKTNVLGSVLYVAAHPDDENTSMISYFANQELMETGYLSATRGDGGQNLIGADIREKLGLIRTQELLAARSIDGGNQFFSRATDFGYSKHPNETFNIWDKEKVLADFVWVIRNFQPDIMITRFSEQPGVTHGHHTASAILAREAFKLAGDKSAFPEQLQYVDIWQPEKLFWNTSWWFYRITGEKLDTTGLKKVDVGKYNPLLGLSYSEMAASSRSMHKSQGFGATGTRGTDIEYLEQLEGKNSKNLFDDINTSWSRLENGESVGKHIENALFAYDHQKPWVIVDDLLMALEAIENIKNKYWKDLKKKQIMEVLAASMGLYLEATANDFAFVAGDSITISFEAVNRSDIDVSLKEIFFDQVRGQQIKLNQQLSDNNKLTYDHVLKLPDNLAISNPYWLQNKGSIGMYDVKDQLLIGKPENSPSLSVGFVIDVAGVELIINKPVVFKKNDPVEGEKYQPLEIIPPVFVNIESSVNIFSEAKGKPVQVKVIAGKNNLSGKLSLSIGENWQVSPSTIDFTIDSKGNEHSFTFHVIPPEHQEVIEGSAIATIGGKEYSFALERLIYEHIPVQGYYPESRARFVKIDLKRNGNRIGYIQGAGDDIPTSLEQVGYEVDFLTKDDIEAENLRKYDAVICGVRAFNTVDWLSYKNSELFKYVEDGGNLLVQYNTSHRLITQELAPYSLELSRDRITVEETPVRLLNPNHDVWNYPNKITINDFDNWVQERGLYFPNKWSKEFEPLTESGDPGEDLLNGGLLVAKYGKGNYIYTGYSWFRELPAGVPGAYRIFVNLISQRTTEDYHGRRD